jgi:uncharacterized membrane protein YhaH (DUF805 family)
MLQAREVCTEDVVLANLLWLLFDWRGCISRGTYRIGLLVAVLLNQGIAYGTDAPQTTRLALSALSFVMVLALEAKRFHDIGRSAAWILWVNLATLPIGLLIRAAVPDIFELLEADETLPMVSLLPQVWPVQGAVLGLALGSFAKGLWLSFARSTHGLIVYARVTEADKVPADPGLASALERALAEGTATSPEVPTAARSMPTNHLLGAPALRGPQRGFGKRGLSPGNMK